MTQSAASTINLDDLESTLRALQWKISSQADEVQWAGYDLPAEYSWRYAHLLERGREVQGRLEKLAVAAQSASQQYAWREQILNSVSEEATGHLMWLAGQALPGILITIAPEALAGIAVIAGGIVLYRAATAAHSTNEASRAGTSQDDASRAAVNRAEVFLKQQFGAVGAQLTALAVSGADNFIAGLLGMPEPATDQFGPQALTGIATTATALVGAPFLNETKVTVEEVRAANQNSQVAHRPNSLADMVSRIPHGETQGEQIRIEKYESDGTYIVYLGGTVDSSLTATEQPWDMTSNVTAMADGDAGSERATLQAMRAAGITANDKVILVGHSQGGLIAARIAQNSNYHVTDLVTVGAPIHGIEIPQHTNLLAIEHTEDVIPSLSGMADTNLLVPTASAGGLASSQSIVVRNSTFNDRAPQPGQSLAAHSLTRYMHTAQQLDQSADPTARAARERILIPSGSSARGQTSTVTLWRATRTD